MRVCVCVHTCVRLCSGQLKPTLACVCMRARVCMCACMRARDSEIEAWLRTLRFFGLAIALSPVQGSPPFRLSLATFLGLPSAIHSLGCHDSGARAAASTSLLSTLEQ